MRYAIVLLVLVGLALPSQPQSQQAQQPLTRNECDSIVKAIGETPGKLRSVPFKKLHELEVSVFECSSTHKIWAYSVADATISQMMLERCEDFIHEQSLDDKFFAWDERLYGK